MGRIAVAIKQSDFSYRTTPSSICVTGGKPQLSLVSSRYHSLRLGQSIAALSVGHIGARGMMRAWRPSDALNMAEGILDGVKAPEWTKPAHTHRRLDSVCCVDLTSATPQPGRLSTFF